jgi:DNA sulfur modification protein DndB
LVFRPVGILPLVQAAIAINKRTDSNFANIFQRFNEINFILNSRPWEYVLWNPIENKMLVNAGTITFLMLIYLYGDGILLAAELAKLRTEYAAKIAFEGDINTVLENLRNQ